MAKLLGHLFSLSLYHRRAHLFFEYMTKCFHAHTQCYLRSLIEWKLIKEAAACLVGPPVCDWHSCCHGCHCVPQSERKIKLLKEELLISQALFICRKEKQIKFQNVSIKDGNAFVAMAARSTSNLTCTSRHGVQAEPRSLFIGDPVEEAGGALTERKS